MEIVTSQLPSGGSTYNFPSVRVEPLTFQTIFDYSKGKPEGKLARFLYDLRYLKKDDDNIGELLLPDVDFLIFLKMSATISNDMSFKTRYVCPNCDSENSIELSLAEIDFAFIEDRLKSDLVIDLNKQKVTLSIPTVDQFLKVAGNYVRSKQIDDLDTIKMLSLIKEYLFRPNPIQELVLSAIHEDISTLAAVKQLYFNKLKPIHAECEKCNRGRKESDRRHLVISIEDLAIDPFRDVLENNPIVKNKVLFEQIRQD